MSELTLREIYRYALSDGLTSVEAGQKYNCNPKSLLKIGCKYKLPKLKTEYYKTTKEQISRMNDVQLLSYSKALELNKNQTAGNSEKKIVDEIIAERNLKQNES